MSAWVLAGSSVHTRELTGDGLAALQAELAASTSRFEELRHLATEAVHAAGQAADARGAAVADLGSRDGPGFVDRRPAAADTAFRRSQQDLQRATPLDGPSPQDSSQQLLPRLLAAVQAQQSVWQRVKVTLLAHFSRRLRAQLAETRAAADSAAAEAAGREAAAKRRLQDASRVRS